MRHLFFLTTVLLLGTVVGCSGPPSTITPAPIGAGPGTDAAAVPAEYQRGEQLYGQYCAQCHGQAGAGTDKGPPFLNVVYVPGHHPDQAFVVAATLGVQAHHWQFGDMPPVDGITEPEVAEITAYVRFLQRQVGIE